MAVGVLRPVWSCRSSIQGSIKREFQSCHLKKISFPRICLQIIVVLNARVNFAIILVRLIRIMFTIYNRIGHRGGRAQFLFRDVG